jgi:hypothetical protein
MTVEEVLGLHRCTLVTQAKDAARGAADDRMERARAAFERAVRAVAPGATQPTAFGVQQRPVDGRQARPFIFALAAVVGYQMWVCLVVPRAKEQPLRHVKHEAFRSLVNATLAGGDEARVLVHADISPAEARAVQLNFSGFEAEQTRRVTVLSEQELLSEDALCARFAEALA